MRELLITSGRDSLGAQPEVAFVVTYPAPAGELPLPRGRLQGQYQRDEETAIVDNDNKYGARLIHEVSIQYNKSP